MVLISTKNCTLKLVILGFRPLTGIMVLIYEEVEEDQ